MNQRMSRNLWHRRWEAPVTTFESIRLNTPEGLNFWQQRCGNNKLRDYSGGSENRKRRLTCSISDEWQWTTVWDYITARYLIVRLYRLKEVLKNINLKLKTLNIIVEYRSENKIDTLCINIILRYVRITIAAVKTTKILRILSVCLKPYSSSMKCACALFYCHFWPVWFYHIFLHYLINGRIFGKSYWT